MKTKILSVVNKKGGVGKSTTVSALASICARYDKKVLVVDLDPQTNISSIFNEELNIEYTITDLLLADTNSLTQEMVQATIYKTKYRNIDLIHGDMNLDEESDKILLKNAYVSDNNNIVISDKAQTLLTKAFQLIDGMYDIIFIDNTPYFNLISKNALSASTGVIIPIQNDGFSLQGLGILLEKIYEIKGKLNDPLEILGVFLTNVNPRTTLYKDVQENLKVQLNDVFMKVVIRNSNKVKESNTVMIPLYEYDQKDRVSKDYLRLAEELNLIEKH